MVGGWVWSSSPHFPSIFILFWVNYSKITFKSCELNWAQVCVVIRIWGMSECAEEPVLGIISSVSI